MKFKFKFILIFFVLLFPFTIQSRQTNLPDSTTLNLQSKIDDLENSSKT